VSRGLRRPTRVAALVLALAAAGCGGQDRELQKHEEKLQSLGTTTALIADDWASGNLSPTFARTAFEQTFTLVEQERTALAADPNPLADPRGAKLSESAERLSRLLATMIQDVGNGDRTAIREHAQQIPIRAPEQP
jgi:hypothetical protein